VALVWAYVPIVQVEEVTLKKVPTFPIGAVEAIIEAQQLLTGERDRLTSTEEYTAQRRRYWQMQANRAPRRFRSALPRRAA
jgi:hypothetical protein